jgi:hypothetical protein
MATTVDGSTGVSQIQETVTLKVISTGSVPSLEAKGTSGVTSGYLKLNCSENSHGIKLLGPPHSATADYTLTFPNNDGDADQFLQTNGSGVMTWAAAGGGLTQLASFATTSGTTVVSPTLDLSTYKFLYITQDGVGWTSDTGGVQIVTPNGGSSVQWTAGTGPTNSFHVLTFIDLSTGIGNGMYLAAPVASIINGTGGTVSFVNTGISTSTTSLTFGTQGAVAFVRGNMKLYGLK